MLGASRDCRRSLTRQQEDAALLERGDDLEALLGRQTVGAHAETGQLVCNGVLSHIADGVMKALG